MGDHLSDAGTPAMLYPFDSPTPSELTMPGEPTLFDAFDRATLSRRQLLKALGTAAIAIPASSFAQGGGGRRGGAQRDTTPLVLPFQSTGWKTVWLDHLSYQCVDYEKAAAFYVALMGWKVRSDDGKQAVLDIGENCGDIIIHGGLTAPPPAALTDADLGPSHAPVRAVFDGFAWGIEPWNTDAVKAELERRGLSPVADHAGPDYQAFHIKDPDGFNLWITNGTKARRRKTAANGTLKVAPPFTPTDWTTLFVDHLSYEVSDYRRTTAFYEALLGWKVRGAPTGPAWPDSPQSLTVEIGTVAGAIIRSNASAGRGGGNRGRGGGDTSGRGGAAAAPAAQASAVTATIGHISFGIDHWNVERVRAALIERDVVYVINGQRIPRDDIAGGLESVHVPDAMGWDLQISNRIGV